MKTFHDAIAFLGSIGSQSSTRSPMHGSERFALPALALMGVLGVSTPVVAEENVRPAWAPDVAFVQAGSADDAWAVIAGLAWESDWARSFAGGTLNFYWEAALGRWSADEDDGRGATSGWFTQFNLTPVLRWYAGTSSVRWFLEAGIGASAIFPVYRSSDKRFSTSFNFADHIGIGARFGDRKQHEVILRYQHFSNAGIKHPNPGQDFVQLRYAFRF